MFILTGHATLVDGNYHEVPVNTLYETLAALKKDFSYVRHSMNGDFQSEVVVYEAGEQARLIKLRVVRRPGPLRYLSEIIATYKYVRSLRRGNRSEPIVFIGVDPLNALSGLWLKKRGYVDRFVFFTPDYSEKRFNLVVMNWLYHLIDRTVVRGADAVWNVSQRIMQVRSAQGVSDERNVFVPNVPSKKPPVVKKVNHGRLITLGILGNQLDFINLFDAIEQIKSEIPDIELVIVGSGPEENSFKDYVKQHRLEDIVSFKGYLQHADALREIAQSGIGLALYNGNWGFNYFGDSMKCREFFSCGLPVITTDTHSTVKDITDSGSGLVVDQDKESYVAAIKTILTDYKTFSGAATALAEQYATVHRDALIKEDQYAHSLSSAIN